MMERTRRELLFQVPSRKWHQSLLICRNPARGLKSRPLLSPTPVTDSPWYCPSQVTAFPKSEDSDLVAGRGGRGEADEPFISVSHQAFKCGPHLDTGWHGVRNTEQMPCESTLDSLENWPGDFSSCEINIVYRITAEIPGTAPQKNTILGNCVHQCSHCLMLSSLTKTVRH